MPSYNCQHPTCQAILSARGFCPAHAAKAVHAQADYDRYQRDPRVVAFYNSARWRRARAVQLAHYPLCQLPPCQQLAEHVHHIRPVKQIINTAPQMLYGGGNLQSLCAACHNRIEKAKC